MQARYLAATALIILLGCAHTQPIPPSSTTPTPAVESDGTNGTCVGFEDSYNCQTLKLRAYQRACWQGDGGRCYEAAALGQKLNALDKVSVYRLYQQACTHGDQRGCQPATKIVEDSQIHPGRCYPSYYFGCVVNQKMNEHHLGLACTGSGVHSHAILEVKSIRFYGVGPINTGFEFQGTKTMRLDNGFDAEVDLWKECTVPR